MLIIRVLQLKTKLLFRCLPVEDVEIRGVEGDAVVFVPEAKPRSCCMVSAEGALPVYTVLYVGARVPVGRKYNGIHSEQTLIQT